MLSFEILFITGDIFIININLSLDMLTNISFFGKMLSELYWI